MMLHRAREWNTGPFSIVIYVLIPLWKQSRISVVSIDNSSPPSAAYMRHWIRSALIQVIACRLFGAKPLPDQCWPIVNWTLGNKFQWNSNRNSIIFIYKNTFEIVVCEKGRPFCPGRDELITWGPHSLVSDVVIAPMLLALTTQYVLFL